MEEVPAHEHPGPIVPDVLSRQHEHRSGLIWSGDHETYFTDLQCRRFGRNLFQCYSTALGRLVKKEPLEAWIMRALTGSKTDDDLILCARGFIFLLIGEHMLFDFSGNLVHIAVRKWSISVGREYRVLKSMIDTWTARCYHHSDDNYC
ncbi:hypothetical protein M9H77_25519 [Catharanthus roseus]|uniref:Uncharacterized protein n=1 Tax=Catharanthus roseus TaxID=4058 RepID=A0ACC0A7H7_CATRO|nr:hypothetical protein M9H77_25519 [Catharanthus roseus]